ncbi:uncharacterized protein LOC116779266 [Danaus plexippus]|uniref:uncharacterized protein LOC116779266 n=1 Tax=Danaus plexippus TaxID=13037 RepID=UPI002AB1238C|nr:uncharacterized protein LOC116779266 [Danaus plexippus]
MKMRFNHIYYFLYFTLYYTFAISSPVEKDLRDVKEEEKPLTKEVTVSDMEGINKVRVKRQSGAGKYTEAAKMPKVKQMRLFLQLFKNFWDAAYIGGSHPFHPNIPKAAIALYKQKIVEFFVPDVGRDPNKEMA